MENQPSPKDENSGRHNKQIKCEYIPWRIIALILNLFHTYMQASNTRGGTPRHKSAHACSLESLVEVNERALGMAGNPQFCVDLIPLQKNEEFRRFIFSLLHVHIEFGHRAMQKYSIMNLAHPHTSSQTAKGVVDGRCHG